MEPQTGPVPAEIDYLVVGSGFGGSVVAASMAGVGGALNFWDPSSALYGLFNVWSFDNVDAIVSSGLGGGSLIYANVMLEKPAGWFIQPRPDGTGDETWSFGHDDLQEHYDAVNEVLHVQTMPEEYMATESTKTRRFL